MLILTRLTKKSKESVQSRKLWHWPILWERLCFRDAVRPWRDAWHKFSGGRRRASRWKLSCLCSCLTLAAVSPLPHSAGELLPEHVLSARDLFLGLFVLPSLYHPMYLPVFVFQLLFSLLLDSISCFTRTWTSFVSLFTSCDAFCFISPATLIYIFFRALFFVYRSKSQKYMCTLIN